jgi:hypothetical protein
MSRRGIVQRLVYGSPKPRIVVRFHVPLPRKYGHHPMTIFLVHSVPRIYCPVVGATFVVLPPPVEVPPPNSPNPPLIKNNASRIMMTTRAMIHPNELLFRSPSTTTVSRFSSTISLLFSNLVMVYRIVRLASDFYYKKII